MGIEKTEAMPPVSTKVSECMYVCICIYSVA